MSSTDLINRLHRSRGNLADPSLSDRAIFILGCQRSGTTLLYMLLTSHPAITGKDEREVHTGYPLSQTLSDIQKDSYLCYKIPSRTGELQTFQTGYPDAHFFWIIRNPYATISSMKSLVYDEDTSWLRTSGVQELQTLSEIFPTLKKLNTKKLSRAEIGAYIWKYKIKAYEKYRTHFHVKLVMYEDLVLDTKNCLKPLLQSLKVKWNDDILHHTSVHKDTVFWGNNRGDQPIDPSRAKPELHLSIDEIQAISQIIQPELVEYYPEQTQLGAGIQYLQSFL